VTTLEQPMRAPSVSPQRGRFGGLVAHGDRVDGVVSSFLAAPSRQRAHEKPEVGALSLAMFCRFSLMLGSGASFGAPRIL
jgi:hypothetical protein